MGYGDRGGRDRDRGGFGGGRRFGSGGGGGGRESNYDRPQREPPVHVGDEYDVQITDVAAKGDGICKIEGFIIFVAGTSKGENCRVKIREVRHRFGIADKVGEASAPAENGASSGAEPMEAEMEGEEEQEMPQEN